MLNRTPRLLARMVCTVGLGLSVLPLHDAHAGWKDRYRALERMHGEGRIRVFYSLRGPDALPPRKRVDVNRNGIPDRIENVLLQLKVADAVYRRALNLRSPLDSPRYRDRVKYLDVHVLGGDMKGYRGRAYDALINFRKPIDGGRPTRVLFIDIKADLSDANLTPAHELFHQYQNGYTLFKNRWFTEGMARWVESALARGDGRRGGWPRTRSDVRSLWKKSYAASRFWAEFAHRYERTRKLSLSGEITRMKYVGGGRIVRDLNFRGPGLVRRVLEALDRADDVVSRREGLKKTWWRESRQRSSVNNPDIWRAVVDVARKARIRLPR